MPQNIPFSAVNCERQVWRDHYNTNDACFVGCYYVSCIIIILVKVNSRDYYTIGTQKRAITPIDDKYPALLHSLRPG